MAVAFGITGGGTGKTATVFEGGAPQRFRPTGLIAYTEPYEQQTYQQIFAGAVDDPTDIAMNIDGTALAATIENVHDGLDNTYWTAVANTGTWTFNNAATGRTGQSISGLATVNGDQATITNVSTLNPNDYFFLRLYINITGVGTGGGSKALNISLTNGGTQVGNTINLYDEVVFQTGQGYQEVLIELSRFNLGTGTVFDGVRFNVVNTSGQPVDFHLDDITIESQGGREYRIKPVDGELTRVYEIELTVCGAHGLTATTFNQLNPLGFLWGSALPIGIDFARSVEGFPSRTINLATNLSFAVIPGFIFEPVFGDGTNAVLKAKFTYSAPLELNPVTGDYISIRINDDFSSYLSFTFGASVTVLRKPDNTTI